MKKISTLEKVSNKIQETLFRVTVTAIACGYSIKMLLMKEEHEQGERRQHCG